MHILYHYHVVLLFPLSFISYLAIIIFLAALGLRCCARAFSSCSEWGLLFVAARGPLIAVGSRCRAWGLGTQASVVAACRLSSCSTWALDCTGLVAPQHVGSSQTGAQTVSPALAGRFSTTAPQVPPYCF